MLTLNTIEKAMKQVCKDYMKGAITMTAKIIKHPRYYGQRSAYHIKINGIIDNHKYINVPANKAINNILGRIK